jgi:hypothetical protein
VLRELLLPCRVLLLQEYKKIEKSKKTNIFLIKINLKCPVLKIRHKSTICKLDYF